MHRKNAIFGKDVKRQEMHKDIKTKRQTVANKQTDKEIKIQTDKQTKIITDRQTNKQTKIERNK